MCNCKIGILSGWTDYEDYKYMTKENYKEEIQERVDRCNKIDEYYKQTYGNKYKSITTRWNDFFDKGKELMELFSYCPDCGEKINLNDYKQEG